MSRKIYTQNKPYPMPRYNNSAGRLLVQLECINPKLNYGQQFAIFYGYEKPSKSDICQIFIEHLPKIQKVYTDFEIDIHDQINEQSRQVVVNGLSGIIDLFYPEAYNSTPRAASPAELSIVEIAATLLRNESIPPPSDIEELQELVRQLINSVENSNLEKLVKQCLLEIAKLAHNAIFEYQMYGSKSYKKAIKLIAGEFLEVINESDDVKKSSTFGKALELIEKINSVYYTSCGAIVAIAGVTRLVLEAAKP